MTLAIDSARFNLSDAHPLLLVEPFASAPGGHPAQALPRLTAAAARARRPVAVVAMHGIDKETAAAVARSGARIVVGSDRRFSLAGAMLALAKMLEASYRRLHRRMPTRQFPHQLQLLGRCLGEAGSLRAGREALGANQAMTAVVLTANLTLHATASALAGFPHLRYLHEISRDESRLIRVLEWVSRCALRRTCVFCTTRAVQEALLERYPSVKSVVQTFALDDPSVKLDDIARQRARQELGLVAENGPVGSVVGGWWRVKDMDTVARAVGLVRTPFTLLVAGYRMDQQVLNEITALHSGHLRVIDKQLTAAELARVYAASDFTIVSRVRGGKESGIVLDAASRGIPVVVSDHDDAFTQELTGLRWVRIFRCGDPSDLARALDEVCSEPMPRPPAGAAAVLGMLRAEEMLDAFDRSAETIC